ncbi:hypothetical protein [Blastococcus sp. CT_GayMR20]|uniref:hypothetical protein n=1 Tax=Blastococcus sp. CT_GayMR20 TaxID=2559609 RepID=UPI00142F433C|nr:hypothetical protein [Blastococcus sp. CT_GayMR20]
MRIRRSVATLFTVTALFSGGTATLSACGSDTAEDTVEEDSGNDVEEDEGSEDDD